MALRRTMADYQQAGTGGIVFMWLLQAGSLPMSYEQRRTMYRSIYSAVVAKIETMEKYKEDKDIGLIISGTFALLNQAGGDYKSRFETKATFDNLENNYAELLAQIYDQLWRLVTITGMIEKVTVEQDVIG